MQVYLKASVVDALRKRCEEMGVPYVDGVADVLELWEEARVDAVARLVQEPFFASVQREALSRELPAKRGMIGGIARVNIRIRNGCDPETAGWWSALPLAMQLAVVETWMREGELQAEELDEARDADAAEVM